MNTVTRIQICDTITVNYATGETAICVLPMGHAGRDEFAAVKGMCAENAGCRAMRDGSGERKHNHA